MTEPKWSTGQPSVALTHIFCGQINGDNAEGFHSRPGNRDPSSAKAYDYQFRGEQDPLRCYGHERVYDAKRSQWIERTVPNIGHFCFFPQAWTIADTVQNIQNIYAHCEDSIDNNRICGRNYMGQGFDVIVFLQEVGLHHQHRVVSSFATPHDDVNCNVNCRLNNMDGGKTEKMEFVRFLLSMLVN